MATDADLLIMHNNGYSAAAIAAHYKLSADSVRSRVSRARRAKSAVSSNITVDDAYDAVIDENKRLREEIALLRDGMYEPSARDDTDWDVWDEEYKRLSYLNRMIVVHTISDMHIPDEDEQCIALNLAINAYVKPDITIFNGDMFDFDVLSLKYKRMYNRRRKDPFLEVEPTWDYIVGEVKRKNPRGIIIATGDNHGQQRQETFINELIPVFGDRITADYNKLVRSDNRVLWLGWVQEVYLHKAIFEHGKKSGQNPALANFKSHGESFTGIAAHAHRWQQVVTVKQEWLQEQRRMLYYPLISVVSGCSQHVPPHYIQDTKAASSTQGSVVSYVNMHGYDTHVQNILYHPRKDGSLVAVYGNQVFEQAAVADVMDKVA